LNEESTLLGFTAQERGQMHSLVGDTSLGKLNHILQVDYLDTEDQFGNRFRNTVGINNYFLYDVCDKLAAGMRFEYYNVELGNTNDNKDIYALTLGMNVSPSNCLKIRPEVRWDWDVDENPLGINEQHPTRPGLRRNQTTFGVDAIVTF